MNIFKMETLFTECKLYNLFFEGYKGKKTFVSKFVRDKQVYRGP